MRWSHCAIAVLALGACTDAPNDPEVRLGAGDLQFIRTNCDPAAPACAPTILADYDLTNPYYNWSVFGDQLRTVALANGSAGHVNETTIDVIPLDETPLIQMRYRSSAPFTEQDEVLLFARDPEEFYQTMWRDLFLLPDIPSLWQDQIDPHNMPGAATLAYPPFAVSFTPDSFVTVNLPPSAFWGPLSPGGVASFPDGSGSVKAARVVQHGRCSAEQIFANGGTGLLDSINAGFTSAISGRFSPAATVREYSAAIPFLHQTETREDSQWGGFFFAGRFNELAFGLSLHFNFAVPYIFRLLDGIGAVDSLGANANVTSDAANLGGHSTDEIHWTLDEILDTPLETAPIEAITSPQTLEQAVAQAFDNKQVAMSDPDKGKAIKCQLRPVGLAGLSRTIVDAPSSCPAMIGLINSFVTKASNFSLVNPPLTIDESRVISNTLLETIADPYNPGSTVLKNFRCNPVFPDGTAVDPTDPTAGVCEVVIRAKRINSYPNAIELVFFDDEHEVDAEAYGLFLFLGGDASAAGGNALCSRRPVTGGNLQSRTFGVSFFGATP